jgi:glycosyltransferase involved in cell wall biosynthesis
LVAPDDGDGFARRVVELLNAPEMRARLGKCAAESMARDHDWNELAARVERIYLPSGVTSDGKLSSGKVAL